MLYSLCTFVDMDINVFIALTLLFGSIYILWIAPLLPPRRVGRNQWKQQVPVSPKIYKPEPIVEKVPDLGPSVLTTKEFIIPKKSGYKPPKISNPTEWFIGDWGISEPSPAEQRIVDELVKYDLDWYREVSFRGLILPTGSYARYDFWLPEYKICIEYQGRMWHSSPERQHIDLIKAEFCQNNNLQLITWHSKHWHNIPETVEYLMKGLRVFRKKGV